MKKRIIIAIGRQFGSGGRAVGKLLATKMGIGYYDKELMAVAAKESGLSQEFFERADEQASSGLAYTFSMRYLYMGGMFTPYTDLLSNDGLFKFQSNAIRKLAENESCIIIGRCADYILRDNPYCISVFIHNSTENRIQSIIQHDPILSVEQAKDLMVKIDKSRASYYNYFTNKEWGKSSSYNMSIDVSVLGEEDTANLIRHFVIQKLAKD
ncbi:MAG: cytidylate kinase-like family protein [Tannerellaceae bacterium]|nr:cytidylate kinase-like family protein [Tannerellaceae bacterium]